jgi:hypothetical protein
MSQYSTYELTDDETDYFGVVEYVLHGDKFIAHYWHKAQLQEYCCEYKAWSLDLVCHGCGLEIEACECGCERLHRCSNCQ